MIPSMTKPLEPSPPLAGSKLAQLEIASQQSAIFQSFGLQKPVAESGVLACAGAA